MPRGYVHVSCNCSGQAYCQVIDSTLIICFPYLIALKFIKLFITFNYNFILYLCRYIQSGSYRGFVEQTGRDMVANELNCSPEHLLLWKIYTDKDISLKRRHIQQKAAKRSNTPTSANKIGKLIIIITNKISNFVKKKKTEI